MGIRGWANNYCDASLDEIMGGYNTPDTVVEIGA